MRTIRDTTVLWALDNTSDVVARKAKKTAKDRGLFLKLHFLSILNSKSYFKKKPSPPEPQTIYSLQRVSRLVLLNGRIVLLVRHKDTMVADGGQSGVDCAHFGCAGSVSLTIFRNRACPHKSLLQIGHGKNGFVIYIGKGLQHPF